MQLAWFLNNIGTAIDDGSNNAANIFAYLAGNIALHLFLNIKTYKLLIDDLEYRLGLEQFEFEHSVEYEFDTIDLKYCDDRINFNYTGSIRAINYYYNNNHVGYNEMRITTRTLNDKYSSKIGIHNDDIVNLNINNQIYTNYGSDDNGDHSFSNTHGTESEITTGARGDSIKCVKQLQGSLSINEQQKRAQFIICEIGRALHYFHSSKNIMSVENTSINKNTCMPRIIDCDLNEIFQSKNIITSNNAIKYQKNVGKKQYKASEVWYIYGLSYNRCKADVRSFGIMIFFISCGKSPFGTPNYRYKACTQIVLLVKFETCRILSGESKISCNTW